MMVVRLHWVARAAPAGVDREYSTVGSRYPLSREYSTVGSRYPLSILVLYSIKLVLRFLNIISPTHRCWFHSIHHAGMAGMMGMMGMMVLTAPTLQN